MRIRSPLCLSLLCVLFFIELTSALYWSQINTTLYYGQRVRHRIAYNRGTQTLVLTGGFSYPGTTKVDTGNQSTIVASLSKQRIPALDVWISRDGGVTWTNTTSSPAFGVRLGHTSLVSYGETFVMGGQTQLINTSGLFYQPTNDIYKSSDYVLWQKVPLPDTGQRFPPRYGHATAFDEVNSIMYVIGGQTNNLVYLNDVWQSSDRGVNWFLKTPKASFAPRAGHSSGFISNTLYVVGGADANTAYSDLWRSYDGGATWNSISQTSLPWAGRTLHTSIVYGPVIMLIGGCNKDLTTGFLNEIWTSTDAGNTWVKEIQPPPFSKRAGAAGAIIDNQVLLVGGYNVTNFIPMSLSDTWTTTLPRNPTNSDGAIVAAIFGIIVLFVGLTYWVWINARRNGLFGMKVNKDRWVQDEQTQKEESEIPEPQADEEDVDEDEQQAR